MATKLVIDQFGAREVPLTPAEEAERAAEEAAFVAQPAKARREIGQIEAITRPTERFMREFILQVAIQTQGVPASVLDPHQALPPEYASWPPGVRRAVDAERAIRLKREEMNS